MSDFLEVLLLLIFGKESTIPSHCLLPSMVGQGLGRGRYGERKSQHFTSVYSVYVVSKAVYSLCNSCLLGNCTYLYLTLQDLIIFLEIRKSPTAMALTNFLGLHGLDFTDLFKDASGLFSCISQYFLKRSIL